MKIEWLTVSVLVTLLFAPVAKGAAPPTPYSILWSRQFGAGSTQSNGVGVDAQGNAFIGGTTTGNLAGSIGQQDAYVAKYDSLGNRLWIKQFGTTGVDDQGGLAVDAAGNALATGVTFGNFAGSNSGSGDAFVAKFDSSGNSLWKRQVGTSGYDIAYKGAFDSSDGSVLVVGRTEGSIAAPNLNHSDDIFLTKLDSAGNPVWTRQIGTEVHDQADTLMVDNNGNSFLAGHTYGNLGGPNAGGQDAFFAKYSATGTSLLTRQFGTTADDQGSVKVDPQGNIYVYGRTDGDLAGTNVGPADCYLVKYNSNGDLLWSKQFGTAATETIGGLAFDASGATFLVGTTDGSLGGPSHGAGDVFLMKLDSLGELQWQTQLGSSNLDYASGIVFDNNSGVLYLSGVTRGNLFGPNSGADQAFLVAISPVPEPTSLILITLASSGLALTLAVQKMNRIRSRGDCYSSLSRSLARTE